ncbi:error-prone DNA polymerase [Sphingomonas sp. BK235]|uniref:error-prone DNA polymerase n=1 Tax=Sphingomonas sp. BK235 TaxID=2512131 RepID=UPI0010E70065|nr:error-prone DNA polymerase [Sphingomonas sp. BK235]TCP35939.1 DNA-directed DNA polymerase III PolC [Sphingomonas sp. BK235]
MTYSELQVTTHFSFLRGASSCEQLVATAAAMGMPALGVVDRNSVAGVVRALYACDQVRRDSGLEVRSIPGCRLDLVDGASLLVWPEDRAGWSRLTELLSRGKARADAQRGEKGRCFLHWEDVAAHAKGLVAALVPGHAPDLEQMRWMADLFGDAGHVCLTHYRRPGEQLRLHRLSEAARAYGLTPLATGDVLYHAPEQRMLQDVVTAIREKCTIDELGLRRERSADRHLKPPGAMARLFRDRPEAIAAAEAIAERCTFSLRELQYQYPDELIMSGRSAQEALARLSRDALARLFDAAPPPRYAEQLEHELTLVERMDYAPYFLTVNSIVSFARGQQILCQGRGSAANSIICYVLGITSIDPIKHQLLFERFISEERSEPPDIDIDFEHERREEVIQWIYESYGHDHAALTAVVSRFRTRGAIREVGKVLGLPEDMTGALASQVWGWSNEGVPTEHVEALHLDAAEPRLALALDLAKQLIGTPRHLSQHPGGFVLTRDPLHQLVPIEPAAMVDRRVIEWEKADIEELGFMKVDILGLGMLGCMRRAFDLLAAHKGIDMDLASSPLQGDDPATYRMIQQADTLGVFQIESRAQMSMLPRMKPTTFYDIAIQVAIVRPGPIQGNMVHPYLKRREGRETVEYPNEALRAVLEKTLGVPLFQEQAMQVAIIGGGFTPGEADELRRAMATFKLTGGVGRFRERLIAGMRGNGISEAFAERLVAQIEGFGSYGFPESHAASFAKIAYASSWMKCHHPDVFCAALLNAQPMGFYAPAQIVRDARAHGVEVRPPCVLESEWDTALVEGEESLATRRGRVGRGAHSDGRKTAPPSPPAPPSSRTCSGIQGAAHAVIEAPAEGWIPEQVRDDGGESVTREPRSPSPPRSALSRRGGDAESDRAPRDRAPASAGAQEHRGAKAAERPRSTTRDPGRHGDAPAPLTPFAPLSRRAPLAPLRLGLRVIHGLSGEDAGRILTARAQAPFRSIEDLWRRSGVPLATLEKLARADAFHALGLDRRQALWAIRGLGETPLPLLAGIERREEPVTLARLTQGREVVEDYRATQMSLRAHPLEFLRPRLDDARVTRCGDLAGKHGKLVEVAGIILVRQRPGSAKGVLFITIEDETGVANGILWPDRFEAQRRTVMSSAMVSLKGRVQQEGAVIHVIVDRVTDLTAMLRSVGDVDLPRLVARGDGATYPGAPDRGDKGWQPRPRSDYHFRERRDDVIPIASHDFH